MFILICKEEKLRQRRDDVKEFGIVQAYGWNFNHVLSFKFLPYGHISVSALNNLKSSIAGVHSFS